MAQQKTDFTLAKMWTEDDVQIQDIDLSIARTAAKPEKFDLGGNHIFVSGLAWDSNRVISSLKTVGQAVLSLSQAQGFPVELTAGIAYEDIGPFDNVYISNAAQPGKMLRLIITNATKVVPFTSELRVLGGDPSVANIPFPEVTVGAGAAAQILAADPLRKTATISNVFSNGTVVRVADSTVSATLGNELPNGASAVCQGKGAIWVYNPLASAIKICGTYDLA